MAPNVGPVACPNSAQDANVPNSIDLVEHSLFPCETAAYNAAVVAASNLYAEIELRILLHNFVNIELHSQGWYAIRLSVKGREGHLIHPLPMSQTSEHPTLNDHKLAPARQQGHSFVSSVFKIRYCYEEVTIGCMAGWLLHVPAAQILEGIQQQSSIGGPPDLTAGAAGGAASSSCGSGCDCTLEIELLYQPSESTGARSDRPPANFDLKPVAKEFVTLYGLPQLTARYLEATFDDDHMCLCTAAACTALKGFVPMDLLGLSAPVGVAGSETTGRRGALLPSAFGCGPRGGTAGAAVTTGSSGRNSLDTFNPYKEPLYPYQYRRPETGPSELSGVGSQFRCGSLSYPSSSAALSGFSGCIGEEAIGIVISSTVPASEAGQGQGQGSGPCQVPVRATGFPASAPGVGSAVHGGGGATVLPGGSKSCLAACGADSCPSGFSNGIHFGRAVNLDGGGGTTGWVRSFSGAAPKGDLTGANDLAVDDKRLPPDAALCKAVHSRPVQAALEDALLRQARVLLGSRFTTNTHPGSGTSASAPTPLPMQPDSLAAERLATVSRAGRASQGVRPPLKEKPAELKSAADPTLGVPSPSSSRSILSRWGDSASERGVEEKKLPHERGAAPARGSSSRSGGVTESPDPRQAELLAPLITTADSNVDEFTNAGPGVSLSAQILVTRPSVHLAKLLVSTASFTSQGTSPGNFDISDGSGVIRHSRQGISQHRLAENNSSSNVAPDVPLARRSIPGIVSRPSYLQLMSTSSGCAATATAVGNNSMTAREAKHVDALIMATCVPMQMCLARLASLLQSLPGACYAPQTYDVLRQLVVMGSSNNISLGSGGSSRTLGTKERDVVPGPGGAALPGSGVFPVQSTGGHAAGRSPARAYGRQGNPRRSPSPSSTCSLKNIRASPSPSQRRLNCHATSVKSLLSKPPSQPMPIDVLLERSPLEGGSSRRGIAIRGRGRHRSSSRYRDDSDEGNEESSLGSRTEEDNEGKGRSVDLAEGVIGDRQGLGGRGGSRAKNPREALVLLPTTSLRGISGRGRDTPSCVAVFSRGREETGGEESGQLLPVSKPRSCSKDLGVRDSSFDVTGKGEASDPIRSTLPEARSAFNQLKRVSEGPPSRPNDHEGDGGSFQGPSSGVHSTLSKSPCGTPHASVRTVPGRERTLRDSHTRDDVHPEFHTISGNVEACAESQGDPDATPQGNASVPQGHRVIKEESEGSTVLRSSLQLEGGAAPCLQPPDEGSPSPQIPRSISLDLVGVAGSGRGGSLSSVACGVELVNGGFHATEGLASASDSNGGQSCGAGVVGNGECGGAVSAEEMNSQTAFGSSKPGSNLKGGEVAAPLLSSLSRLPANGPLSRPPSAPPPLYTSIKTPSPFSCIPEATGDDEIRTQTAKSSPDTPGAPLPASLPPPGFSSDSRPTLSHSNGLQPPPVAQAPGGPRTTGHASSIAEVLLQRRSHNQALRMIGVPASRLPDNPCSAGADGATSPEEASSAAAAVSNPPAPLPPDFAHAQAPPRSRTLLEPLVPLEKRVPQSRGSGGSDGGKGEGQSGKLSPSGHLSILSPHGASTDVVVSLPSAEGATSAELARPITTSLSNPLPCSNTGNNHTSDASLTPLPLPPMTRTLSSGFRKKNGSSRVDPSSRTNFICPASPVSSAASQRRSAGKRTGRRSSTGGHHFDADAPGASVDPSSGAVPASHSEEATFPPNDAQVRQRAKSLSITGRPAGQQHSLEEALLQVPQLLADLGADVDSEWETLLWVMRLKPTLLMRVLKTRWLSVKMAMVAPFLLALPKSLTSGPNAAALEAASQQWAALFHHHQEWHQGSILGTSPPPSSSQGAAALVLVNSKSDTGRENRALSHVRMLHQQQLMIRQQQMILPHYCLAKDEQVGLLAAFRRVLKAHPLTLLLAKGHVPTSAIGTYWAGGSLGPGGQRASNSFTFGGSFSVSGGSRGGSRTDVTSVATSHPSRAALGSGNGNGELAPHVVPGGSLPAPPSASNGESRSLIPSLRRIVASGGMRNLGGGGKDGAPSSSASSPGGTGNGSAVTTTVQLGSADRVGEEGPWIVWNQGQDLGGCLRIQVPAVAPAFPYGSMGEQPLLLVDDSQARHWPSLRLLLQQQQPQQQQKRRRHRQNPLSLVQTHAGLHQTFSFSHGLTQLGEFDGSLTNGRRRMEKDESHAVILVHGFQGAATDLCLVKAQLLLACPYLHCLASKANEGNTHDSIQDMGQRLALEVVSFLEPLMTATARRPLRKVSFVGHSIGNLIMRAAISTNVFKPYRHLLWMYVSLSGPHLGFLYTTNTMMDTGMAFLKSFGRGKVLHQLTFTDASKPRDCYLYRLAKECPLNVFRAAVVLVSSPQDKYVPWHSSSVSPHAAADKDSKRGPFFRELLDLVLGRVPAGLAGDAPGPKGAAPAVAATGGPPLRHSESNGGVGAADSLSSASYKVTGLLGLGRRSTTPSRPIPRDLLAAASSFEACQPAQDLPPPALFRVTVEFSLKGRKLSLSKLVGRTAHIEFIETSAYAATLIWGLLLAKGILQPAQHAWI